MGINLAYLSGSTPWLLVVVAVFLKGNDDEGSLDLRGAIIMGAVDITSFANVCSLGDRLVEVA